MSEKDLGALLPRVLRSDELEALAARCEKEEPSLELDEAIAAAVAGAILERQKDGRAAYHRDDSWVSIGAIKPCTSSLDAAVTLVPEDCGIEIQRYWMKKPGVWWSVGLAWGLGTRSERVMVMDVATAPLAICAAALRARAALAENVQAFGRDTK